jgi:uncharacterized protein (TIGR02147 family)
MPNIFDYSNYRTYLQDYFAERKAKFKHFSYRYFSDKIGFKSKDFIYRVITGNKKISQTSIAKISNALGHTPEESRYFEALVNFNQAKTAQEKEFHHRQMMGTENNGAGKKHAIRKLSESQLELFADWYSLAIRALIEMVEFTDNYTWLANQLVPRITPKQAKSSVRKLEKSGLIKKDEKGIYRVTDNALATNNEVNSLALTAFYRSCARLTVDALQKLPRDKRHISGVTLGMSRKNYERLTSAINRFREEVAEIANQDDSPEQVFQLYISLFPMSEHIAAGGKQ